MLFQRPFFVPIHDKLCPNQKSDDLRFLFGNAHDFHQLHQSLGCGILCMLTHAQKKPTKIALQTMISGHRHQHQAGLAGMWGLQGGSAMQNGNHPQQSHSNPIQKAQSSSRFGWRNVALSRGGLPHFHLPVFGISRLRKSRMKMILKRLVTNDAFPLMVFSGFLHSFQGFAMGAHFPGFD